jgi:CHAT domain-containing protein/Tfp pilus assembly protein PilF
MDLSNSLVVVTVCALAAQEPTARPEIITLLNAGDEAGLLEELRLRSGAVRDAFGDLFQLTVRAAGSEQRVHRLLQAEQLARLYERVWSDSFFIFGVQQFRRWSADERAEKLQADSLRRAGIEAYYSEGPEAAIRLWERSLGQYRALGDLAGQAAALGNLGAGYYALGRLDRALRHHQRSLELSEAAGDHRTKGNALGNVASVYKDQGELALAAEYYGRALEVRPLTGDRGGEAADLNNLGLVRGELGDVKGAEEYFRRALELNRRDGRGRGAANNLTNLANVATKKGAYDDALNLYSEALALRRETGDRQGEALDLENIGLLHLRWGDYPAALRSLNESLAILNEMGLQTWGAEVRSDVAAAHAAMGHLQAAVEELDRAEAAGDEYLAPTLALQRADLLAELNDFEPAVELYREAKAGYGLVEDAAGQAEAEQGLGYLYLARGDYDAAEEAFTQALLVQEKLDDPRPAALTHILLGDVQFLQKDTAAARASYRRALAAHQALGDVAAEAASLGALADLDRELGALASAESIYRAALARLEGRPVLPLRWHLHLGLGLTLRAEGKLDEAAAQMRSAIAQVEAVGGTFPVEERRYGYLADKWSAYAELARTEVRRGDIAAAFQASERMRARQLVDLLARGRTSTAAGDPRLIREEQNLRQQIGELTSEFHSFSSGSTLRGATEPNTQLEAVRESLVAARAQYERLLVKLKESRPEYAALVTGPTASVSDVQSLLPLDAILVEYLVHDDWTAAFVVSKEGIAAVELPTDRNSLRQLVEFYRGTVRPPSGNSHDDLWRTPLRRLYRVLIEPLADAGYLHDRRLLVFAPHAELNYLPFHALLESGLQEEAYLIESYDVVYVPSGSVWMQLARRGQGARGHGLLAMAPRPKELTNSGSEVRAVGRGERRSSILVGSRATEDRFLELASDRGTLHLATRGVLNTRNPLFSYVRLNPGEQSDGRLEVHEVFGLSLTADLVVLSACETGLGTGLHHDVPPGDDWVGLVRAFLHAGAQNVVASLWPVDDRATAQLMGNFYAGLRAGRSKATALADAQRALIRDEEEELAGSLGREQRPGSS